MAEVPCERLAKLHEIAIRVSIHSANCASEFGHDLGDHRLRNGMRVLVDVETHSNTVLGRTVRGLPHEILAKREIFQAGHPTSLELAQHPTDTK